MLKRMFDLDEENRGPDEQLKGIAKISLDKVIPCFLRPLEIEGRLVKPDRVH